MSSNANETDRDNGRQLRAQRAQDASPSNLAATHPSAPLTSSSVDDSTLASPSDSIDDAHSAASYTPTPADIPPPSTTDIEIVALLSTLSLSHLRGMERVVIEVGDPGTFQILCAQVDSWNSMLLGVNAEPLRVHLMLSPRTNLAPFRQR